MSFVRTHKVVKMYSALYLNSRPAKLTDADYQTIAEIEAIMRASADVAVLVQTERLYVKAIGWPLQMRMFECLRADTLEVIRLSSIKANSYERREKSVSLLNPISKEVRRRSALEAERRFAANETEELTNDDPVLDRSTMLATLLDPRTATCMHLPEHGRPALVKHMIELLKEEYIVYGINAFNFHESNKIVDVDAAASPASPADSAATGAGAAAASEPRPPPAKANAFGFDDEEPAMEVEIDEPSTADVQSARRDRDQLKKDLAAQFQRVHRSYVIFCQYLDWPTLFPELNLPADGDYGLIDDLIEADIVTKVIDLMIARDPTREKFGFLPYMATGSKASVGSHLASSFAERINSAANLILTTGNTLLADDEVDMLCVLRMNRAFMQYMRDNYGYLSRQQFRMTLIAERDNEPGPEVTKPYKRQKVVPPKPPAPGSAQPQRRLDGFFSPAARPAAAPPAPAAPPPVAPGAGGFVARPHAVAVTPGPGPNRPE